jgi:hypothetical protein
MSSSKPDPAMRAIAAYLSEHPGAHDLDAIAAAASVSKPIAGKVLKHLVDARPSIVHLDEVDGKRTWAWTQTASSGAEAAPAPRGETSEPDATKGNQPPAPDKGSRDSTKPETTANDRSSGGKVDPTTPDSPPQRDADQVIMHAARTLATAKGPMTTAEIAAAGYLSAQSLHLLTALRALAFHSLVECSKPFEPDAPDCTWQWNGKEAMELLSKAATVDLGDAPDSQTCPTCGTAKAIPGIAKDRKRGGNLRLDGKTRLGNNELADMVKAWVEKPENAGKTIKPVQMGHELRKVHGDRVAKATYGSISKALAKLTEFDPAHKDQPPLLTLESDKPITYRIRELP